MRLKEVTEIVEAEIITGIDNLNIEVKMGCASDLMSDVLAFAKPDSILLTGLTHPQVVRTVEMADIKAICFVRGKRPEKNTIKLAESKRILLLMTHLPMFETCGRLYSRGLKGLGYLDITERDG